MAEKKDLGSLPSAYEVAIAQALAQGVPVAPSGYPSLTPQGPGVQFNQMPYGSPNLYGSVDLGQGLSASGGATRWGPGQYDWSAALRYMRGF
jgi:hypothetical protein